MAAYQYIVWCSPQHLLFPAHIRPFRLTEGVDVYFLAKQMRTSVKMIEDHYGQITPVKNADRILLGLPGWQSAAADPVQDVH